MMLLINDPSGANVTSHPGHLQNQHLPTYMSNFTASSMRRLGFCLEQKGPTGNVEANIAPQGSCEVIIKYTN